MKRFFNVNTISITALSVLLLTGLLLSGCDNPIDSLTDAQDTSPQSGLLITLGGLAQRTLVPAAPEFDRFEIHFNNTSYTHDTRILEGGETSALITTLQNGLWDIYVIGRVNGLIVAEGYGVIEVDNSSFQGVVIDLKPIIDRDSDNGFFNYTVLFPVELVKGGELEIFCYRNRWSDDWWLVREYERSQIIPLSPGFYRVNVYIELIDGTVYTMREVLHIYSNMETVGIFDFTGYEYPEAIKLSGTVDFSEIDEDVHQWAVIGVFFDQELVYLVNRVQFETNTGYWEFFVPSFDALTTLYFYINFHTNIDIYFTFPGTQDVSDADISGINFTARKPSIVLSETELTLTVGDTEQLDALIAIDIVGIKQPVTWFSTSPGVATVSSTGLVTALTPGTATIIATTYWGTLTATCEITVIP